MFCRISAVPAYRSLPNDYTRKVNINKAYKSVKNSAAVGKTILAVTGLSVMLSIANNAMEHALFNFSLSGVVCGLWGKDIHKASELKPAYKEILKRKKSIYHK